MAKWEIPKRRWGNHITFMRTHATFCGFRQNKVKRNCGFRQNKVKTFCGFRQNKVKTFCGFRQKSYLCTRKSLIISKIWSKQIYSKEKYTKKCSDGKKSDREKPPY